MILKIKININKRKEDNIRIIMKKTDKLKNDKNIKINKLIYFFLNSIIKYCYFFKYFINFF